MLSGRRILILVPVVVISVLVLAFCGSRSVSEPDDLVSYFNRKAIPLDGIDDLDLLIEEAGRRDLVLLGESTHGTTEFYSWRAAITRRLIEEKDFSFIAVEGDFAAIYRLNKYVKHLPEAAGSAREVVTDFNRWPQWMWANEDVVELAEWLHEYNSGRDYADMVGFYGMDVYGHWQAMTDLDSWTRENLSRYSSRIESKLLCFARYSDEQEYARAAARGNVSCQNELEAITELLMANSYELRAICNRSYFRALQNSYVVRGAEAFYRLAGIDYNASWNGRATHMWHTVQRLSGYYGSGAKGIVWAHNTHIGDARATSMGVEGLVNIGSLSRVEGDRDAVFSVGFSTYRGRVSAGSAWGTPMQLMNIPSGIEGSYEHIFGSMERENFYLFFDDDDRANNLLREFRGHRAIGVVYNPSAEAGNYVPTILPERYDALVFIRETNEVKVVR